MWLITKFFLFFRPWEFQFDTDAWRRRCKSRIFNIIFNVCNCFISLIFIFHFVYLKIKMFGLFKICFKSIRVYGFSLNISPTANQGLSLLNISHVMRKSGRVDEAIETEILLGLSMLSQRKYIQASEILKKCSKHFLLQYQQTT